MNSRLLEVKDKPIIPEYFPTVMQTFIFRNWEMVSKERLAKVLGTSIENVEREAFRMGLRKQGNTDIWQEKGYITILRANWHILPYNQLLELLDWTEERLITTLKEDDFLEVKFGSFKPDAEPVKYHPLTDREIEETKKIKEAMDKLFEFEGEDKKEPFDFWSKDEGLQPKNEIKTNQTHVTDDWGLINNTGIEIVNEMAERFALSVKKSWGVKFNKQSENNIVLELIENKEEEYHEIIVEDSKITIKGATAFGILRGLYRLEDLAKLNGGMYFDKGKFVRVARFKSRFIYSFSGLYETAFEVDSRIYCPDSLLEEYAKVGVNGIYLQGILYKLTEFPYAPEMSKGWQDRLKRLKEFSDRAARYGIKIYLYLNEPRTMPLSVFEDNPDMKGAIENGGRNACMCISSQKTRDYLYNAVLKLCEAVPELGGFFTITMSENLTNCKARPVKVPCDRCKDVPTWDLISTVNNIIAKAAHTVNPNINVMAWDVAWDKNREASEDAKKCVEKITKDVAILCQIEEGIPFERGGIKGKVMDYSLSVEGLSEKSVKMWDFAKEYGHETAVKVQINNTWECSTTPYIPIYRTIINMANNIVKSGIDHVLLSWTLGGYPSPNIKLFSEAFFVENGDTNIDFDKALRTIYGEETEAVIKATEIFSDAFSEFPFDIGVAYVGPQNAGPSNIFYHKPTGYTSTMTCYAYDDLENWRKGIAVYPEDIFRNQFKLVSEKWSEGLKFLNENSEIYDISYVSYSLMRSSYNIINFVMLRDLYIKNGDDALRKEITEIVKEEKEIASKVYEIMTRRPEVGYEAANHYYFSKTSLMEKVINCDWLLEYYKK